MERGGQPKCADGPVRLLVVEDEFLLAGLHVEIAESLGFSVAGPAGTVEDALDLIASTPDLDAAILDINLQGEHVFPVADALAEREVPFIFTSGYERDVIPERYREVRLLMKPLGLAAIEAALRSLATAARTA